MEGTGLPEPDMDFHGIMYEHMPDDSSPFININSDDFLTLIRNDLAVQNPEEISLDKFLPDEPLPPIEEEDLSSIAFDNGIWNPRADGIMIDEICNIPLSRSLINYINQDDACEVQEHNSVLNMPEAHCIMVNPRLVGPTLKKDWTIVVEPQEEVKPYHPTQDHDYILINTDKEVQLQGIEKLDADTAEPEVDVWEIQNFVEEHAPLPRLPVPSLQDFPYHPLAMKETRRTSKRTADMKRRDQARLVSNAVHAVLNPKKPVRRYKNIRPKNSVETTPSQSDIEEWHSQAVRPTCSKITKKKTTKGRIDHSESERHRREVLRRHFHLLRGLIPTNFLIGEKATSQISKQKILTGAKRFMENLYNQKKSRKTFIHQNSFLKEQLCKLARSTIKRQKTL